MHIHYKYKGVPCWIPMNLNAMSHTCVLCYCISCAWERHVFSYNIIFLFFFLAKNLVPIKWYNPSLQLHAMLVLQYCCDPCCDIVWHTYDCSNIWFYWIKKNKNLPFSCLDLHWTWSLFSLEWMIVKEKLKAQHFFSFCFFMVDCKRYFKSSYIVEKFFDILNAQWNFHGCHSL